MDNTLDHFSSSVDELTVLSEPSVQPLAARTPTGEAGTGACLRQSPRREAADASPALIEPPEQVRIWGLSLACVTYGQTIEQVDAMIQRRRPSYFITANLHYAMLSQGDPRLQEVNRSAAFLVADGMPLVWYSRLKWRRLPQRVAGADLIYLLAERAAARRYRVFLLGGAPGVAQKAAENLQTLYSGLQIVGTESPELDQLSGSQHEQLLRRIRGAQADLLLVAFGQPKGELWIAQYCEALGVPVCIQLGASFDFVAGRILRAPRWVQRIGMEWLYRVWREPRRMLPRYYQDARFLLRMLAHDLWRPRLRSQKQDR